MPQGMCLKSEGFASNLSSPDGLHSLWDFCKSTGQFYAPYAWPVPVSVFVDYGLWFQRELVPAVVTDRRVTSVELADRGFRVRLQDGGELTARRVVTALGVLLHPHRPAELSALPPDLLSHSSDHSDLSRFAGAEVVVLGAGQSALETGALLEERGARPLLVTRAGSLCWNPGLDRYPAYGSLRRRLRMPISGLGPGWDCLVHSEGQALLHRLPESRRLRMAYETYGPAGAWWLRPRFESDVPVLYQHSLVGAEQVGGRVRLQLAGPAGGRSLDADHVIAATGYRPSVDDLAVVAPPLRTRIRRCGRGPSLTSGFETSVKGLYVTGVLAASEFGPSMRFVHGTRFAAGRVGRSIAAQVAGRPRLISVSSALVGRKEAVATRS
ncbi:MAG: dimethylaniline monooxygenase [Frankiales bacterium]|nr:dimethylaniline monooxygenase [Frankiales bacterium]